MKFLVDAPCDAALVGALRDDCHQVLYAFESLRGASDEVVLNCAFSQGRILLAEYKDSGELVYRLRRPARGIVLLRFDLGAFHLD